MVDFVHISVGTIITVTARHWRLDRSFRIRVIASGLVASKELSFWRT